MHKIFFILLLLTITILSASSEKVYKVLALKEWKPYYSLNKDNKPEGYAIDLFETLAKRINIQYEYVIVDNWNDAHKQFRDGKIDIFPNMGLVEKRLKTFDFTQPTDLFEIGLFKRKNAKSLKSTLDLKNKTVGVVLGNICEKLITLNITDTKVTFQNFHRAVAALNNSEIEVLCYPKPLMQNTIKNLRLDNIEGMDITLKEIKRGIGISKNESELLNLLDREILRIKQNGEYAKIYAKWFLNESKDIELNYEEMIFYITIFIVSLLFLLLIFMRKKWLVTKKQLEKEIYETQEQLIDLQKEKLEDQKLILTQAKITAVGEMIGNISHQWRQPLSIITTSVSSIKLSLNLGKDISNDKLKHCIEVVEKQSLELSKTINDFRDFFMADSKSTKIINLANTIEKLEDLISTTFKNEHIQIIRDVDDIEIKMNDNILIQAFLNFYNNSKDAFIEHNVNEENRYFFISINKKQHTIEITFKDSAGGIDEDIIDKIFEPYFTTKHQSVGTGIGLYMTNQIITKHLKGSIIVENTTYTYNNKTLQGVQFIISIPYVFNNYQ